MAVVAALALCLPAWAALGFPSSSLQRARGEVFDDWEVCRTRSAGHDGFFQEHYAGTGWPPESFRPQIVFESLGDYADTACRLGREFGQKYPDPAQRAEKIFHFARDNVRYRLDQDQFGLGEFAQNADELAQTVVNKGSAYGDCEDMAILLVVMMYSAGLRSAIVDCPSHAGVVVHLPGYEKANKVLQVGGEPGWVWAEATGKNNPFGWFPEGQLDGPFLAYEISADSIGLARASRIVASPPDLGFRFVLDGASPPPQTLAVKSSAPGTMQWSLSADAAWMTAAPAAGTCGQGTDYVTLSADATGLAPGSYQAAVTISSTAAANSPVVIPVYLDVTTTAAGLAAIALSSADYSFKASVGGSRPAVQVLVIANAGPGTMRWSVSEDAPWLSVSPKSGLASGEYAMVQLEVDPLAVSPGKHEATVTVSAPGVSNSPQTVKVRLEVDAEGPVTLDWVWVFLGVAGIMLLIVIVGRRLRRA